MRRTCEFNAQVLRAALKDYQVFLESELMPCATDDWRIGKKKFAKKLELVLDAGMTADQVLADAETEFARVHRDLYVVSRQLWGQYFSKQSLPPDDVEGRRVTIAKVISAVSQEHGKPEELLANTQATVARIKTFIRERDILQPEFEIEDSGVFDRNRYVDVTAEYVSYFQETWPKALDKVKELSEKA